MPHVPHLLLTLCLLPVLAFAGDLPPAAAPGLARAVAPGDCLDAETGAASACAGLLTGIEAVDAPEGTGEETADIVYHSEVLAAPVAMLRETASLGAQSTGGAGSFRRWLGSEEAESLTAEGRLGASFAPPATPWTEDAEEASFPLLFAGAGLSMASCLLRIGGARRRKA